MFGLHTHDAYLHSEGIAIYTHQPIPPPTKQLLWLVMKKLVLSENQLMENGKNVLEVSSACGRERNAAPPLMINITIFFFHFFFLGQNAMLPLEQEGFDGKEYVICIWSRNVGTTIVFIFILTYCIFKFNRN